MRLHRSTSAFIASVCLVAGSRAFAQTADSGWVGQRIVMLSGMGEVHSPLDSMQVASQVGINLVMPVTRVEGRRLWVVSTSGGDSGWVDSDAVRRLPEAIPYFTHLIEREPSNWDAYLRRAEAEHALNQRDAATADYSKAIELHPAEAFLYLRRGRHYNSLRACDRALSDFDKAITLAPTSAPRATISWSSCTASSLVSIPGAQIPRFGIPGALLPQFSTPSRLIPLGPRSS